MCPIINAGYNLGKMIIYPKINVICGYSHDTASAVNVIDNFSKNDIFISCGTWSLLGTIIDKMYKELEYLRTSYKEWSFIRVSEIFPLLRKN